MIYQFKSELYISDYINKTIIFNGSNNAIGFVENNEITIQNNEYIYEYRKGAWSIGRIENMIMYPCGVGAVPTLNIDNLVILNRYLWDLIKYIPPIESV